VGWSRVPKDMACEWNETTGVAQVPWTSVPAALLPVFDGGYIVCATLPPNMRSALPAMHARTLAGRRLQRGRRVHARLAADERTDSGTQRRHGRDARRSPARHAARPSTGYAAEHGNAARHAAIHANAAAAHERTFGAAVST